MAKRYACIRKERMRVEDVWVQVHYKRIKHGYLHLHPQADCIDQRVVVCVPQGTEAQAVEAYVRMRLPWIHRTLMQAPVKPVYRYGERMRLWGDSYTIEAAASSRDAGVKLHKERKAIILPQGLDAQAVELEKWQPKVGVQVQQWRIKDMNTRWGSCNPAAKRIWLRLQLAHEPPVCLEYVLVHELVHLLEASHNQIFKGHLDRLMPGWRQIQQQLRKSEG